MSAEKDSRPRMLDQRLGKDDNGRDADSLVADIELRARDSVFGNSQFDLKRHETPLGDDVLSDIALEV